MDALGDRVRALGFDRFAQFFAATVQMGSHGADGQAERERNLLVAALFLMIKHEDAALDGAEPEQVGFDLLLKLVVFELLLGAAAGMLDAVFPGEGVVGIGIVRCVGEGDEWPVFAAAALPLVLGDVDGDAVEIGGDEGFAAKVGQRAEEAQEDLLGEIVEMLAGAGEAQEGAADHGLMVPDDLVEGEIDGQAGLDNRMRLKFHRGE